MNLLKMLVIAGWSFDSQATVAAPRLTKMGTLRHTVPPLVVMNTAPIATGIAAAPATSAKSGVAVVDVTSDKVMSLPPTACGSQGTRHRCCSGGSHEAEGCLQVRTCSKVSIRGSGLLRT